jgi:hypothetical protein
MIRVSSSSNNLKPFTASDEIENELSRLEERQDRFPRPIRSLFGALRCALRPEAMTAYATIAAAFAAFMSVRVAEQATFASNVFDKQIDALADFELKFKKLQYALDALHIPKTPGWNPKTPKPTAADYDGFDKSAREMLTTYSILSVRYPYGAAQLLTDIFNDTIRVNTYVHDYQQWYDNQNTNIPTTNDIDRLKLISTQIQVTFHELQTDAVILRKCSDVDFQVGLYIGEKFLDCYRSMQPSLKKPEP